MNEISFVCSLIPVQLQIVRSVFRTQASLSTNSLVTKNVPVPMNKQFFSRISANYRANEWYSKDKVKIVKNGKQIALGN
jgi:hypothetical protein